MPPLAALPTEEPHFSIELLEVPELVRILFLFVLMLVLGRQVLRVLPEVRQQALNPHQVGLYGLEAPEVWVIPQETQPEVEEAPEVLVLTVELEEPDMP